MAVTFDLFRLSLVERPRDLFDEAPGTREDYLRQLFGARHAFGHFGHEFVYLPQADVRGPLMMGQIGRPFLAEENLPPDQGFAPAQHEAWKAAVLALDPREHPDGQKVSFQREDLIGQPFPVLRAFVSHLNTVHDRGAYHVEIEPIFSPTSFWAFAEANRGSVTSVTFEFVTPNMFGTSDELSEELREMRRNERAQKVTVKIQSSDGLNTDTEKVRESVEYARKGAGKIAARAKGGRRYDSTKQSESVTVEDVGDGEEPVLVRAARRLSDILGLN